MSEGGVHFLQNDERRGGLQALPCRDLLGLEVLSDNGCSDASLNCCSYSCGKDADQHRGRGECEKGNEDHQERENG
jgi:hypothetical protein